MTIVPLSKEALGEAGKERHEALQQDAVKVLQIGEGNFLRGFFDWMISESRKKGNYQGSIAVVQPRPGGKPKIEALAAQDGLYTLVIRGLENGEPIERKEIVDVFGRAFDPYENWDGFLELAESPDLQIVVSNTTEAGVAYRPEVYTEGVPVQSYPGKLAVLLFKRYTAFGGDPSRGLYLFPCELLERNGDALRDCVLRYCEEWALPEDFISWVREHNVFFNSLVDRIVTGYPDDEQAEAWFGEWDYRDPMLTTAEPYHLWAIEGEPEMENVLPLARSGLNVLWVKELKPYQQRKVRILNGAHTLMALTGLLNGMKEVRETMEHGVLGQLVTDTVSKEIIPSLPYDAEELGAYAEEVMLRFLNPYIRHRLSDIAMNSASKFKTRLLPSLLYYLKEDRADTESDVPDGLLQGLAALLRYYKVKLSADGYEGFDLAGLRYIVQDDPVLLEQMAAIWSGVDGDGEETGVAVAGLLGLEELWGCNLNNLAPGLASAVADRITQWERRGHE